MRVLTNKLLVRRHTKGSVILLNEVEYINVGVVDSIGPEVYGVSVGDTVRYNYALWSEGPAAVITVDDIVYVEDACK